MFLFEHWWNVHFVFDAFCSWCNCFLSIMQLDQRIHQLSSCWRRPTMRKLGLVCLIYRCHVGCADFSICDQVLVKVLGVGWLLQLYRTSLIIIMYWKSEDPLLACVLSFFCPSVWLLLQKHIIGWETANICIFLMRYPVLKRDGNWTGSQWISLFRSVRLAPSVVWKPNAFRMLDAVVLVILPFKIFAGLFVKNNAWDVDAHHSG